MISDPPPWESDDDVVIRAISERLDFENEDGGRLTALAGDMQLLLANASSNGNIIDLAELVADRQRVIAVGRRYLSGDLTRTSFLSYVARQRWPDRLRQRIGTLTLEELSTLIEALHGVDVTRLEAILAG
jgi:hypothetical protein